MDQGNVADGNVDCVLGRVLLKARIAKAGTVFPGALKMKVPKELGAITDVVLAYRPPEKQKAATKRQKRKAKRDAKKG